MWRRLMPFPTCLEKFLNIVDFKKDDNSMENVGFLYSYLHELVFRSVEIFEFYTDILIIFCQIEEAIMVSRHSGFFRTVFLHGTIKKVTVRSETLLVSNGKDDPVLKRAIL